jgi:predicted oxidoreductase
MNFSKLAFGAMNIAQWNLPPDALLNLIEQTLALGITTFDHADIYGGYTSEELFGNALARKPALRNEMQLVTKCGIKLVSPNRPEHRLKTYDSSRSHILHSVENSLKKFRTDRLDALLIHRPDTLMNADELAEVFALLHQAGKVLHFGVSNFTVAQVELVQSRLPFPLIANQIELSAMHLAPFNDGVLDQVQRLNMTAMAWSPLAGGRLFNEDSPRAHRLREKLHEVAAHYPNTSPDQIALAWLFRHPANVVPVLGTGKIERLKSAAAAAVVHLTQDEWYEIWKASTGEEIA